VKQLRKLSRIYNQTFAAFYLPNPPKSDIPALNDYRRQAGTTLVRLSPELALDIRTAWERRGIVLDLYEEQGETPAGFDATTEVTSEPEQTGIEIRGLLSISYEKQSSWRDPRIAFNNLRGAIESLGVLVFQSTNVSVSEVRGYSLSQSPLPVIVVNRKDSYSARNFTMLHELTHIMLHVGGLCDLVANGELPPEESKAEVFCNRVASAVLLPKDSLLNEPVVKAHLRSSALGWADEDIELLSKIYCASREAVVRRLMVLGLATKQFYEVKRKQYQDELKYLPKRKGFVSPSVDLVSASGKPYVRTVLDAFFADRITASDVADYLGIRLKHLDQVASVVGTELANI
jgi:Zn-dependent peptidase ImmA (M78 family)